MTCFDLTDGDVLLKKERKITEPIDWLKLHNHSVSEKLGSIAGTRCVMGLIGKNREYLRNETAKALSVVSGNPGLTARINLLKETGELVVKDYMFNVLTGNDLNDTIGDVVSRIKQIALESKYD